MTAIHSWNARLNCWAGRVNNMMRRCAVKITGKVQDVGLRAAISREANQNDLSGWIQNLPSGEVVLEIEGESVPVALFLVWLRQSPGHSQSSDVEVTDIAPQGSRGFSIK